MADILYNIIIFPIIQILEISFSITDRIFRNRIIAIFGVSITVTICTLPLYFIAEKWQQAERDLQNILKPKIKKIKSVFSGDEQYMILSTLYRQNKYHPFYVFRTSLVTLIQIPFFIAAYTYLSNLQYIKGVSFLFINDLGLPDNCFNFYGFSLNILPITMTIINFSSAAIYSKGFGFREKFQIYGISVIFLLLLYNSPAGLVLYWTMNNILSLLKNILVKCRYQKKILYGVFCFIILLIEFHLLSNDLSPKRIFIMVFFLFVLLLPFSLKFFKTIETRIIKFFPLETSSLALKRTYILSIFILFLLSGLVIPGSLISSSVQEFSFLDTNSNPLFIILNVFIQSFGIFIFWPLCFLFLLKKNTNYLLTFIFSLLFILSLVNVFIFPGDYGYLTTTLKFSNPDTFESKYKLILLSSLITIIFLFSFSFLFLTKHRFIIFYFQIIILISLSGFGVFNLFKIQNDFNDYKNLLTNNSNIFNIDKIEPVYNFSTNGKNVIVLMLDAAVSGHIPFILQEKPELISTYSGFVYYPNCVSFGAHTRIGAPALFGGYEYKPVNIQKSRSYAKEKHNEALLMMPLLFYHDGYKVTVTDPTMANYSLKPDLSIFKPYPEINVKNTIGNYTNIWLRSHPDIEIVSIPEILKELFIRFSFLRISPPLFRIFIYDSSDWLKAGGNTFKSQISLDTLDNYTTLDFLPRLTDINNSNINTYTAMVNDLTHYPAFFQYPGYSISGKITETGFGPLSDEEEYHAAMASFILIGNWLSFLKENKVYDNSRIIIASDHGNNPRSKYPENIILPNENRLSKYHAVLLFKDFYSDDDLSYNYNFMTHADVPLLAMKGIIYTPVNPFSGNPVIAEKSSGIDIATTGSIQFKINKDQWLHVKENIFIPSNWNKTIIEFDN